MKSRQPVPSVVSRLMGLEEFSQQQPVLKKPRVLSDKYTRRVSLIGTREKHKDLGYLNSSSNKSEECNLFERDKQNAQSVGKRKAQWSSEVSSSSSKYRSFEDCVKISVVSNQWYSGGECCTDLGINHGLWSGSNDGLQSSTDKVYVQMPALAHGVRPMELRTISSINAAKRSVLMKDSLGSRSSRNAELTTLSSFQQFELGMTITADQELTIPSECLKPRNLHSHHDEYHSASLVRGIRFKKHGHCSDKRRQYGWKVRTIGCLERTTPLHWDLSAIRNRVLSTNHDFAKSDVHLSNLEFINLVLHKSRKQDGNQRYSSGLGVSSRECHESSSSGKVLEVGNKNVETSFFLPSIAEDKLDKDLHGQSSKGKTSEHSPSMESDAETEFINKSLPLNEQSLDKEKGQFLIKDQDDSSCLIDSSIRKDRYVGAYEKESISSYCSCTDPESTVSLEDAYQSSPISILDASYWNENSFCSDIWDDVEDSLHGLHLRPKLLKSEISDVYSEDSDTMVSSQGDIRAESVGDLKEDAMKLFRVEESRDFSYLVDVLNKAGVLSVGPFMGVKPWHSEECIISLSVFDALEKKYGDQTYWKRTDRRLLFDSINSGLLEILQSSFIEHSRSNTVARRLILSHGKVDIEDELWMLLGREENGVGKDSEIVLGKDDMWMELGYEIQSISTEIASCLFDELVEDAFRINSVEI
ncbi:hypothetical protein LINPERHAP1_LOCUS21673 [Linum perenne]